jgi:hypothetical protein
MVVSNFVKNNINHSNDSSFEIMNIFLGDVVLEYVDHRPHPTCTGKRIYLKQNTASLWDDVLRMNQAAGGTWTQEMAVQVESQLLVNINFKDVRNKY